MGIQEKSSSHASNVWVFSDSQESLRLIGKNQVEQEAVHQSINTLAAMGCIVHLHWVPGHNNIAGNESADKAAKDSLKDLPMANTWISTSYIQRQIRANTIHQWRCHYDQTKTGKHYQQFDRQPGDHRLQWLKGVDRLMFSTLQQLTFGYGYFRSYTGLINQESRMCRTCHRPETPKHLLMECRNNNSERQKLRKNLGNFGLPTLLTTKKGIENTIQYLQKTRIATRKWILGDAGISDDDAGGWGQLEHD